jgi:hypothetical protein
MMSCHRQVLLVLQEEGPPTGAVETETCICTSAAESAALLSGALQAPVPIMASNSVAESTASPVGSLQ